MEEKNEILTEENYEKGKKQIKKIALIVLIFGLLIGGSLIAVGIKKANSSEEPSEVTRTKEEIQVEIDSLNSELATLKAQQNQEFRSNGFSEKYYLLDNEINTKKSKVSELEMEKVKSGSEFNTTKKAISDAKSYPFYMFGGFIIVASCMISGSLFMFTKRREILAFQAQQIMPVAKEGIDKMAPTVGNAVGEVAKGITKGIKTGLKDDDK